MPQTDPKRTEELDSSEVEVISKQDHKQQKNVKEKGTIILNTYNDSCFSKNYSRYILQGLSNFSDNNKNRLYGPKKNQNKYRYSETEQINKEDLKKIKKNKKKEKNAKKQFNKITEQLKESSFSKEKSGPLPTFQQSQYNKNFKRKYQKCCICGIIIIPDLNNYESCQYCYEKYHIMCKPKQCPVCYETRLQQNKKLEESKAQQGKNLGDKRFQQSKKFEQNKKKQQSKKFEQTKRPEQSKLCEDRKNKISISKTYQLPEKSTKKPEQKQKLLFFPLCNQFSLSQKDFKQKCSSGLLLDISEPSININLHKQKQSNEEFQLLRRSYECEIISFVFNYPQYVKKYDKKLFIVFPVPKRILNLQKFPFISKYAQINYFFTHRIALQNISTTLPEYFGTILKLVNTYYFLKHSLYHQKVQQIERLFQSKKQFYKLLLPLISSYFDQIRYIQEKECLLQQIVETADDYNIKAQQQIKKYKDNYNNLPSIIKLLSYFNQLGYLQIIVQYFWPRILSWILIISCFKVLNSQNIRKDFTLQRKFNILIRQLNILDIQPNNRFQSSHLSLQTKKTIIEILLNQIQHSESFKAQIENENKQVYCCKNDIKGINEEIQQLKRQIQKKQQELLMYNIKKKMLRNNKDIILRKICQYMKVSDGYVEQNIQSNLQKYDNKRDQQWSILKKQKQQLHKKLAELLNKKYKILQESNFQLLPIQENNVNRRDLIKSLINNKIILLGQDHHKQLYWYLKGYPNSIFIEFTDAWRQVSASRIQKLLENLNRYESNSSSLIQTIKYYVYNDLIFTSCNEKDKNIKQPLQKQSSKEKIRADDQFLEVLLVRKDESNIPSLTVIKDVLSASINNVTKYLKSIKMEWQTPENIKQMGKILLQIYEDYKFSQVNSHSFQMKFLISTIKSLISQFHNKIINYYPCKDKNKTSKSSRSKIWPNFETKKAWLKSIEHLGKQFSGTPYNMFVKNIFNEISFAKHQQEIAQFSTLFTNFLYPIKWIIQHEKSEQEEKLRIDRARRRVRAQLIKMEQLYQQIDMSQKQQLINEINLS